MVRLPRLFRHDSTGGMYPEKGIIPRYAFPLDGKEFQTFVIPLYKYILTKVGRGDIRGG